MKLILRIFNLLIIAASAVAMAFLFISPAMTFKSKVSLSVEAVSEFMPKTQYDTDIDIVKLLGTDKIDVGVKFELPLNELNSIKSGNKEQIDQKLLADNIDGILSTLHEPIDLITEYEIRSVLKSTIKEIITEAVQEAADSFNEKYGGDSTAEEIMDETGIDDEYFSTFSNALYEASNKDDATIDSVSVVLYEQIDEALSRAESSGSVDTSTYGADQKEEIKNNLINIYTELDLIEDGNHVRKISTISYYYLAKSLREKLEGKVDASELDRGSSETVPDYCDRLISLYIYDIIPAIVYQIIGYVGLGLLILTYVYMAIWGLLILITFIKTFTRKPWTFFGPLFWLIGGLQIITGIGLTVLVRYGLTALLDKLKISIDVVSGFLAVLRTSALIPSMIFIAMIVVAFIYGFFKRGLKREQKMLRRVR